MVFNSITFIIFLPTVFCLFWLVFKDNLKLQNALLIVASYVFYGWWDRRFLALIILSSFIDFFIGQEIFKTTEARKRKLLLYLSLSINLGMLGFFKYFNFFINSFVEAFASVGIPISVGTLKIILPVGISFYTFQTLSYTIDIYRKQLEPTKSILDFFAFVSFFPQLVAGPIERAKSLLPQFAQRKVFNYEQAREGVTLMLWGMFKKVVIADNLSTYVDLVYSDPSSYTGMVLVLATLFFTFQIYCEFSGYSDIAIGVAKLFGFELMINFRTPYFANSIRSFWQRWHISLSTWFKDYVYIPLGGNRVSSWRRMLNILITFTVSGLWHGANWTYIIWGFIHGIFNYLETLTRGKITLPKWLNKLGVIYVFFIVVTAWVFFRANSVQDAFIVFSNMRVDLALHLSSLSEFELMLRSFISSKKEGYCS